MPDHEEETSFDEVLAPVPHARRVAIIAAVGAAAALSFFDVWRLLGLPFDAIGLLATLVGGWPVWREAWEAIREREINMEITMALGVAAALVIGHYATAAIIVSFTLFSMYLEELTKSRGKRALEVLLRAAPATATILRDGRWVDVPAEEVRAGERVLVKAGAKIPVDGHVLEGHSSVNEAAITGEPFPQEKTPGARVFAGTVNGAGGLEVEATHSGSETTYARIIRLVREATERRGRTQRLADKVAQGIVYVVLVAALVTWLATRDPITVVSVILVAGACGVAAGTPLAILATTAKSARRGVILKGGETVEGLARVDTVVFDKTGTLTLAEPKLEDVLTLDGSSREAVLDMVASVEQGNDHPIARAIVRAHAPPMLARETRYVAGRGVMGIVEGKRVLVGNRALLEDEGVVLPAAAARAAEDAIAKGRIVVYAAVDGRAAGALVLADEVRAEARASIQRLQADGLRVLMLTGDRDAPAREVARQLGIADVRAELLPEDKIRIVQELKREGRRVCFVGDGINDAPALAEADVGVALQSGTEAAAEIADALLMTNDLGKLAEAIRESRRSQSVIMFNFAGTMAIDLVGILLASLGLLGPLLAALVHVGSELAFILNSARLFSSGGR